MTWKHPVAGGGTVPDPSALADNKWLKTESGVWVAADPPGGGGLVFPDSAPASPSAFNDEYTAGTLDAKWTATLTPGVGTVDPDFLGTWLQFSCPGAASGNVAEWRQALSGYAAGTAFQCSFRLALGTHPSANQPATWWRVTDDTTPTNSLIVFLRADAGVLTARVHDGSEVANIALPLGTRAMYFTVQRNTSNVVRVTMGLTPPFMYEIWTGTKAWDFGYQWLRYIGDNTAGNHTSHGCDFVRFGDPRHALSMP